MKTFDGPTPDEQAAIPADVQFAALQLSACRAALVALAVALRKNGALLPGQYQAEIRAELNRSELTPDGPQYDFLNVLAILLDNDEQARAAHRCA